jgi:glycosidase
MQTQVPNERWAPFLKNHDQTRTLTVLGGDLEGARLAATFLLTLPGLPFVYYGEELGMTGDKPDPRIRTPMHWNLGHAAGFTTGTPWEPLQDDWQTANVEVLDGSEDSILDLYRELIRLRLQNPALGASAELVPLRSNVDGAVAYLRRGDSDAALVVANLGTEPLADVDLWSESEVLAPGDYAPEILLGEGSAAPLTLGASGRLDGYVPLATLEPRRAYVLAITSGP